MTTEAAAARVEAFLADWCTTSTVAQRINGRNVDLLASDLRLILDALPSTPQPPAVRWASNWGSTRRHVINERYIPSPCGNFLQGQVADLQAVCSQNTWVRPAGHRNGGIGPANSPSVMALLACKLCERKVTG